MCQAMPVEEIVRDRQDAYYGAISDADRTGDARRFIEFMLVALRDALVEVKRSAVLESDRSRQSGENSHEVCAFRTFALWIFGIMS